MLSWVVIFSFQPARIGRETLGTLPESFDPAKGSFLLSPTSHQPNVTNRPLGLRCAPTGTPLSPFSSFRYGPFLSQRGGYTPPSTHYPACALRAHDLRLAYIQPLFFLSFTDSFCTMDARNPFAFNRFRTLSIAMGVYTPLPESRTKMKPGSASLRRLARDQNALADRPVLERKRPSHGRGDSIHRTLYDLGKVRDTRRFEVDCKWGIGSNQPLIPFTPRVPLWRCEMFNSQVHRNLWLALAAAALLTVAGCSNKGTDEASNAAPQPATAKPARAAKPGAAAKPAAAKHAVAHKAPAPEPTTMVTVPKGTAISATVGQTLATDTSKVGDTFAATLATPVEQDGMTVIPKGAHITGRIVKVKKHELKVTLASVVVHGKSYDLETNSVKGSKSQAKDNAGDSDQAKANKDVTLLNAKSQLTFKLAKPVTIPVKG
jgi:hypothetical protein